MSWVARPPPPAPPPPRVFAWAVFHCWLSAKPKPAHIPQRFRAGRPKPQDGGLCHPYDFENTPGSVAEREGENVAVSRLRRSQFFLDGVNLQLQGVRVG